MLSNINIFLDSGAFSAWSRKKEINIEEYIEFIKKNKSSLFCYANLDVIRNPEKSYENQKYMEKKGLNPIPVFHTHEDYKWLKRYLLEGYEYIALGGLAGGRNSVTFLIKHLDTCFNIINNINPTTKIHGFGIMNFLLLKRYPWYSVDSTTYRIEASYGVVFIPPIKYNEYHWLKKPIRVCFSTLAAINKSYTHYRIHYDNPKYLSEKEKEKILKYIEYIRPGTKLGNSQYIFSVPLNHSLKENERWYKKNKKLKTGTIEKIYEIGIKTSANIREEINKLYFLKVGEMLTDYHKRKKIKISNSNYFFKKQ